MRDAVALIAERTHGKNVLFFALGDDALSERIKAAEVRVIPDQTDAKVVAGYYQACMLLVPIHFPTRS